MSRRPTFKLEAVAQALTRMYASAVHRSELETLLSSLSNLEIQSGEHCAYQEAMLNEAADLTDEAQGNTPRFFPPFEERYESFESGTPEFQDCMMTVQRLSFNFSRMILLGDARSRLATSGGDPLISSDPEQSFVSSYRSFAEKRKSVSDFDWLRQENSRLKDTLNKLHHSTEDSSSLRDLYDQECSKVNKLNTRLNQLQAELIELQDLVDDLTVERSRLEGRLEQAGDGLDCKKCKKYKDRLTAVQNKTEGQQGEISELKTHLALARQRDAFQ